jgi:glycosyltransferase involved in cell wall biosynthesis
VKINWFSPLPPAKTGIADRTRILLPALVAKAEVTLWTDQSAWDRSLEQLATVRRFDPAKLNYRALHQADMTFFNLGNNTLFHAAIWEAARRFGGVAILHDLRLQHFFSGHYRTNRQDRAGYVGEMQRYYKEEGRVAAESVWAGQSSADETTELFPLTELAVRNALGVIVHTGDAFQEVREMGRWPLAWLPLPGAARHVSRRKRKKKSDPYRIIMFGYMGANRRVESVLEALASFPQRASFRLDIYGELANQDVTRIDSLQLDRVVQYHGLVSEEALDAALGQADLGINLRYPTMGEASGSQLQLWEYSVPALVTPVGFYAELPAATVCFVRPENEVSDIHKYLDDFLLRPDRFQEMGRAGREYLEQHHAAPDYADGITRMARLAREFATDEVGRKLADRAGRHLGNLLPEGKLEPACQRAGEAISTLFC